MSTRKSAIAVDLLRARAQTLRAEATFVEAHLPNDAMHVRYGAALRRAAVVLDDEATAIEDDRSGP